MLRPVFFSLLLFPLLAQCAPASSDHSGALHMADRHFRRDLGLLAQAAFVTTLSSPSSSNTGNSQPTAVPASSASVMLLPPSALPTQSVSSQNSLQDSTRPLVMAYYPDWAGQSSPPESINYSLFDWIDFAFGIPTKDFGISWDSEGTPGLLRRLVTAAHASGTKVKLSIGGWTGSTYFSSAVATNESRKRFAENISRVYASYNIDGIDIDWEYPGHEGANGNQIDSRDSSNFLLFLQCLRAVLPDVARISAAGQTVPFVDSSGQPSKDLSEFANVLDWVLLMNYDVWSSSPTPGPNAPLSDGCKNSTQPDANAVAGYNKWTSAGFPASQLVLGLPSYAYISTSSAVNLRQRSDTRPPTVDPNLPRDDNPTAPSSMVKVVDEDGGSDGQVQFRELVKQGALVLANHLDANNSPVFVAAGGFERHWDSCSSTPYLRSTSAGQVIAYDDPESLHMKGEFAKQMGMLGTNMFDIHGDTDEWDLTMTVRKAMGVA